MSEAAHNLRELYQELILDHGKSPHNKHALAGHTHAALGHNPMCGDKFNVYVRLDAHHKIEDAAFEGQGCAISTASASMMTDMIKGKTAEEAQKLFDYFHALCTSENPPAPQDIDADDLDRLNALSGVRQFPIRVKCATLAWHTLQAALKSQDNASSENE